ncbi:TIGR00730 family Rossman fold protein [Chitinivorax sp. PXF-14]|uniref:LOG family protein n=1 Tax=Chitinivorax sp. PXF-14 TaxID=3230488 RepID=UPI0034655A83
MKTICVFCGSRFGKSPVYRDTARTLGRLLALRGLTLVYGGGNVGLMGEVANACLDAGGKVIGVIPGFLDRKEVTLTACTELHVVDSMHARKARMAELADGFVALPGGFGTFDELFEILTWAQLGVHAKPVGLLDAGGYFAPLLQMVEHAITEDFVRADNRELLLHETDASLLLDRMQTHQAVPGPKWSLPVVP